MCLKTSMYKHSSLREKCPNAEFFWSVFSCIRTEYRKIPTRKNSVFGHFSRSAYFDYILSHVDFSKSCAMRASVVYAPTRQRASVSKACQLLIFTCQRVNKPANVPKACQIFQIHLRKDVPIFQVFFKRAFQFFNISISLNICKFQEYLGNSRNLSRKTKNLNFDFCKISLRKNLSNPKPLTSFSMKRVGLTEQLFG